MVLGYRDDILAALKKLGGKAHRMRVVEETRRIRQARSASIPATFEQTVQQAFERHCIDSDIFCRKSHLGLFHWPHGRGDGTWALIPDTAERYIRQYQGR